MLRFLNGLYVRWRDRHDPAARSTGYSRKFDHDGHDEQKAVAAARRAVTQARVQRKAAAKRALPRAPRQPGRVIAMKDRAGR